MCRLKVQYIPVEGLSKNVEYYCLARNFNVGLWDGEKFIYMRDKFGSTFLDAEQHWDSLAPFGTAKPLAPMATPMHPLSFYEVEDE